MDYEVIDSKEEIYPSKKEWLDTEKAKEQKFIDIRHYRKHTKFVKGSHYLQKPVDFIELISMRYIEDEKEIRLPLCSYEDYRPFGVSIGCPLLIADAGYFEWIVGCTPQKDYEVIIDYWKGIRNHD